MKRIKGRNGGNCPLLEKAGIAITNVNNGIDMCVNCEEEFCFFDEGIFWDGEKMCRKPPRLTPSEYCKRYRQRKKETAKCQSG